MLRWKLMNPDPKRSIRVRLAPSPTGPLHIGTARTALFNWLFARQSGGQFVLRIEDTDRERSKKKFEKEILESLSWLGLNWDEGPTYKHQVSDIKYQEGYIGDYGPYRQSERILIYKKYLEKLLEEKKAYYCYCTKEKLEAERQAMVAEGLPPKYNGHCRSLGKTPKDQKPEVIRFLTPQTQVEFHDLIRGKISFDASLFGDIAIAKDVETPLYNFAVVVDDEEMKISHVIRGEDHLSNTPKQILFQRALNLETPTYAHLPLILAADRSKLSKRYAETSLLEYEKQGFLPQALINFMAFLGWHPEGDEEILEIDEIIRKFNLKKIQKAGAIFNPEKLLWLNSQHLKKISLEELARLIRPELEKQNIGATGDFLEKILKVERERLKTTKDFLKIADFFFILPTYETKMLKWKDETLPEVETNLTKIFEALEELEVNRFNEENPHLHRILEELSRGQNRGLLYWPLRVALSGKLNSPDPIQIAQILGKAETLRRIKLALAKIEETRENHYVETP